MSAKIKNEIKSEDRQVKVSANGATDVPQVFEHQELLVIKQLVEGCQVTGKDALMIGLMINKTNDMIQMMQQGTAKMIEGSA